MRALSQFDSPLVEGVDVPDHALREHRVLVGARRGLEHGGREPPREDRVRRPVALEHAVRDELLAVPSAQDLVGRPPERRLRLRDDVGQEDVAVATDRVERPFERDEVARDQRVPGGSTRNECCLLVPARRSKRDRCRNPPDAAVNGDGLPLLSIVNCWR